MINSTYPLQWASDTFRHPIASKNFTRLALITTFACSVIVLLYKKLKASSDLPWQKWAVTLGLSSQPELKYLDFQEAIKAYSPLDFICRLNATLSKTDKTKLCDNPRTPNEWFKWISLAKQDELKSQAHTILPSSKEGFPLTLESEKVANIQTWAFSLQPLFAFIQEHSQSWKDLLQPIQSTPRLAYTLLFQCLAPFAAQIIWTEVQKTLPTFAEKIEERYVKHTRLIALACLGFILLLYARMMQEKGMLTNLTNNFASSYKVHKGYDLIPSYKESLLRLLRTIGSTTPGQSHANILWFYNTDTHTTLTGQIGNILGEMTATGRVSEDATLMREFPQLKKLEVVELNLESFLTEHRDPDAVYKGWYDTLKHFSKEKETLVVFTGIKKILKHLIPSSQRQVDADDHPSPFGDEAHGKPNEKLLADLVRVAIKQGKFRCLIELSEYEKIELEKDPDFYHLFSAMRAPDLNGEILEQLCERLYTGCDQVAALTQKEIKDAFEHLKPVLAKTPLSPQAILDTIQEAQAARSRSFRLNMTDASLIQDIEKAEKDVRQVQQIKDELLQKLWKKRRQQEDEPLDSLQALLLIEKVVLPLYSQRVNSLKSSFIQKPDLVLQLQKRFERLFGPCTQEEEKRLQELSVRLKNKIKGQDEAIEAICKTVYAWRKIPPLDGKPLVLFLAGSPGVGKSETATQLAFELNSVYGIKDSAVPTNETNVRRINLNRSQQGGIFGWGKVKADILAHLSIEPTAVIILEEWDKMNPEDKSSLLELLDATQTYFQTPWSITSSNGAFVDKSCALFVITSNIEADKESFEERVQGVKEGILNSFSEEGGQTGQAFLSRLDSVIPFQKISQNTTQELIKTYLDEYEKQSCLPQDKRQAVEQKLKNYNSSDTRELQRNVRQAIVEISGKKS